MRFKLSRIAWVMFWLAPAVFAADDMAKPGDQPCDALKNATILVIRHAEKPPMGMTLTPAGTARARAYVDYFQHFQVDGQTVKLDHVFCAADSKGSERPRLTVEPLAEALKLPLDNAFKAKDTDGLAGDIRAQAQGTNLLICWHHGDIPALVQALGADPAKLLPNGKWPDEVFSWVIELRYDAAGRLRETKLIHEDLMPGDRAQANGHE